MGLASRQAHLHRRRARPSAAGQRSSETWLAVVVPARHHVLRNNKPRRTDRKSGSPRRFSPRRCRDARRRAARDSLFLRVWYKRLGQRARAEKADNKEHAKRDEQSAFGEEGVTLSAGTNAGHAPPLSTLFSRLIPETKALAQNQSDRLLPLLHCPHLLHGGYGAPIADSAGDAV